MGQVFSGLIDSFPEARVVLAAPTGKAAKRLFEQTGHRATTILPRRRYGCTKC